MRSRITRVCSYGLGIAMIVFSVGGSLFAGVSRQVPEIDAGSFSAGIGLVTAGVLLLRSRRRSK